MEALTGRIVVESDRDWFGDPRFGTFAVYLDHARAGRLRPRDRLELRCAVGGHVLRIRQWWYRSKPVQITVSEGRTITLTADILRDGNLMRRMAIFLMTPSQALSLKEASEEPS
jgi:hypothetical protein